MTPDLNNLLPAPTNPVICCVRTPQIRRGLLALLRLRASSCRWVLQKVFQLSGKERTAPCWLTEV